VSHICEFIISYFNQQVSRFKITGARPPVKMLRRPVPLCPYGSYSQAIGTGLVLAGPLI